ncbi:MAG TPA: sulfurtransferase TusA family protein [Gammaproteobacteria bacterium]
MEKYLAEGVTLDLSGFRRRFPTRLLRWQVGQLRVAEQAVIAVSNDLDAARLLVELGQCGAEVCSETEAGGGRHYQICKGANTAAEELDVRGLRCPFPVVEARHRLRALAPHVMLRLITDCTAAAQEIGTWAARNPQVALVGAWREHGSEQIFLLSREQECGLRHV